MPSEVIPVTSVCVLESVMMRGLVGKVDVGRVEVEVDVKVEVDVQQVEMDVRQVEVEVDAEVEGEVVVEVEVVVGVAGKTSRLCDAGSSGG